LWRRAMGKKKPEEMAKQREIFVTGAKNRDVEEKVATHIFDLMEKFAGYGFNKSHSAAYALVAYQTAWLKAHNPAAFMAAVLSSDMDNTDKVVTFIEECRTMELKIRTPDVNYSEYAFTVDTDRAIVYGLGAVKGVGQAAIESMVEERAENGAFGDLFDFCRRIDGRKINRRVLEALIRSGAMDDLGANRATLIGNLGVAIQSAEQHAQTQAAGQNDLFGLEVASDNGPQDSQTANYAPHPDWDDDVRLRGEKETLGLYLTGHPITAYEAELESITSSRLADLNPDDVPQTNGKVNYRKRKQDEKKVTVAGLVVAARTMKTQRGGRIAFITLDDRTARIEVSVFTEAYEKFRDLLTSDRLLVVEGGLGVDDFSGQCKVSADHIYDMEQARETYAKALVIQHRGNGAAMASLDDLEEILSPFREGVCPVAIDYQSELATAHLTLSLEWAVRPTDELLKRLRKKFGIESIQVQY